LASSEPAGGSNNDPCAAIRGVEENAASAATNVVRRRGAGIVYHVATAPERRGFFAFCKTSGAESKEEENLAMERTLRRLDAAQAAGQLRGCAQKKCAK
jgi:hypothetical protein